MKATPMLQAAVIILGGWWAFAPAIHGDWLWDDIPEIVQNPAVHATGGLREIWLGRAGPDYFPLKSTVQWLEWRFWGDRPLGYHEVNLGLHLLSALLFWRLLRRLFEVGMSLPRAESRGPSISLRARAFGAWFGGLLFAVHPLTVESVAWIAELKNTLSLALLLGSMLAYLDFDASGTGQVNDLAYSRKSERTPALASAHAVGQVGDLAERRRPRWRYYLLSILFFFAAMLSKSTVAMFPLVLLLYAWWRRGRIVWVDLRASVPFFAISLGLGLVTVWFQLDRAIAGADLGLGGFWPRLAGAGLAIAFYIGKCLWPAGFMPIYPNWVLSPLSPLQFLPWAALGAIVAWFWTKRSGWGRHALFGLGFFGLNLLPVLGFVPMAYLQISRVADHFVYLPMLGLIGLAAAGAAALALRPAAGGLASNAPLTAASLALGAVLAFESRGYAAIFRSEETLWTHALRSNPQAWAAHNDFGKLLLQKGRVPEAATQFEEALQSNPSDAQAEFNLGLAFDADGRPAEAAGRYVRALRLQPAFPEARFRLGNFLLSTGRLPEAIADYEAALRLRPDYAEAHANLGVAWAESGRLADAITEFERALRLDPDYPEAHFNLGDALAQAGRPAEAIPQFEAALRLRPGYPGARENLTRVRALAGPDPLTPIMYCI